MRPVPNLFCFHGRTGATRCDFDAAPDYAGKGECNQHRQKNASPSLITAPPGETGENKTQPKMLWPITESAHTPHEVVNRAILMVCDEITNRLIKDEGDADNGSGNHDSDQPVKERSAVHK